MITLNSYSGVSNTTNVELFGKSTDVKPLINYDGIAISNGSSFFEIDTGILYLYDAEANEWIAVGSD